MALATDSGDKTVLHLHIGAPKTGTSAIQAFLTLNRTAFHEASGIYYPESENDARAMKGKPTAGNGGQIARHLRSRKRESFDKSIRMLNRALTGGHPNVLISSEGFWALPEERLTEFAEAMRGRFDIRIICYARPQVRHVESAYLQVLGNRGYKGEISEFFEQQSRKFLVGTRIQFLQELFGAARVSVRKYDRKVLVGGDVIDDFLAMFGLGWGAQYQRPPEVNTSLDPEHYIYARVAAEADGAQGVGKRAMRDLHSIPLISTLYGEAAAITDLQVMDPGTAQRIVEYFTEDNDLLDRLLPDQKFAFNAENRKAAGAVEAAASRRAAGFTRLELLLLNRLAQLEARVDELINPGGGGDMSDEDD